ncbi:hypothetical protein GUJ93_ZPchr0001g30097 [Zizania palustris]|uniref:Protein RALF-like 33 n=1 Tax=Zizania palustris TaxID=103762 RepID=A0A8J5VM33_ZIZPA|nr:hypothetical protein GUJ93_ZPchr0001g30097 [Zizania palustris]
MAGLRIAVLAFMVAAAAVACLPAPAAAGAADLGAFDALVSARPGRQLLVSTTCDGDVGDCGVDDDEEMGLLGGAATGEALRRSLARKPTNRYISYAALRADQVPCNKRGSSYYTNCASQKAANPYHRGCSAITRCSRNMN